MSEQSRIKGAVVVRRFGNGGLSLFLQSIRLIPEEVLLSIFKNRAW